MYKKFLAILVFFYATLSFAAVDVNKATQADLDGLKGIGPGISSKIVEERKKGSFKDWNDFIERVKGVGEGNAAKFSAEGLTVNGSAYSGAPPAAKKDEKPVVKAEAKDKKADAKVAAPAPVAPASAAKDSKKDDKKADAKAEAKAKKEADAKAKAEEKKKVSEEKKAKMEADKKAKADAKAKKDGAKPAASPAPAASATPAAKK
jgi:competence protein ComEA